MTRQGFAPSILAGIAGLGAALSASAQGQDDYCDFEAERSGVVEAAGAERLDLVALAGPLVIEGRPGLTEVRVTGRACASSQELLDGIELVAERRQSDVRVEVVMAESLERLTRLFGRNNYAWLELVVEVPEGMAAAVKDSSGSIEIRGVGDLTLRDGSGSVDIAGADGDVDINDGSGSLVVRDVSGSLQIHDGSGSIDVTDVGGSVEIRDGSGSVMVRNVGGSVSLADGSGSIETTEVEGDVTVTVDGSGSIYAANVVGDFVVERDGSGSVSYDRIGGQVRTPRQR